MATPKRSLAARLFVYMWNKNAWEGRRNFDSCSAVDIRWLQSGAIWVIAINQ